jgi:uncharacterized protein (TIGR01777 family)
MAKRVVISGATGRLGQSLARALLERGDTVVVLTRDPALAEERVPGAAAYVTWNAINIGRWSDALDGADAVVNLTGASLFGAEMRGKDAYARLARTRLFAARAMTAGLEAVRRRPPVLLSASSTEVYGFQGVSDAPVDERSATGTDAFGKATRDWELAALEARALEVRPVLVRLGFVLDGEGGGLPLLVRQYAAHLGGPTLPSRAWRPWVHLHDAVGLFLHGIDTPDLSGPLNATAPEPRTNEDFARLLAQRLGRASWLPTPALLLRRFVGTPGAVALSRGKRVLPRKAEEGGYRFRFRTLEDALDEVLTPRGQALLSAGSLEPQPI